MVLWRPTRPFRTNTQKRCPFHYRGLERKVRSQETPGVTDKFGLGIWNEAGQRLIEFCQKKNALVIANTLFQQHKRRLYTWTSPDGQHQNQTDYILCSQRWRSSIQSAKTRPGADCGLDHEFLIAKFRLKLKKVGKTSRPGLHVHPAPRACSNSCPSSWWWHPTISSSVVPFSSCPLSFPASGSFPMSQLMDGHEFGWTLGVGDGQGSLVCCNSWDFKELDTTEQLNWTEWSSGFPYLLQFQSEFGN